METEQQHKRQRVSKACEQCRGKKTKCDGQLPSCGICRSQNITCTYKAITKKRGPPKGYIEAIEGRLHRLEALIGSIIQEDDPRFQAILNELNAPLQTVNGELIRPRRANAVTSSYDTVSPTSTTAPLSSSVTEVQNAGLSQYLESSSSLPQQSRERIHQQSQVDYNELSSHESDISPTVKVEEDVETSDNLGNLSVDESGQLRYYGKSSGFYMLRNSQNFRNGAFRFNSRGYRGDSKMNPLEQLIIDPFELPPADLSKILLDLYFDHFYTLLPIVHKDSFRQAYENTTNPPSHLLLNAIYAVASRICSDERVRTTPDQPETAGDIFFERARILLDFEYDDFKVSTVQSLLLMSSHQNGALKSIRGWIYSGMAFRMSQNLGLHCNCDSWDLTHTEKEERKRVFYCCFVIDRLSSAMHGRSPVVDERDCDAPYPQDNDKCDLDKSGIKIMDNFHALIKLCDILGCVLRDVYSVRGRQQLKRMTSPDVLVSKLDKALNNWMSKLPVSARYRPPNTRIAEEAPAPSLALCQIHMLYYTTLILLHRPFIPGPTQTQSPSVFPSREICTYGANKILDIVVSLMKEKRLKNVNNYTLYFMFTAGIIFINDASSPDSMDAFEAKISINKIIHAMDTVETTWITSARHSNILGELAGLRDINLEVVNENFKRTMQQQQQEQEQRKRQQQQSASIVMPNSPVLNTNDSFSTIQPQNNQGSSFQSTYSNRGTGSTTPSIMDSYIDDRLSTSSRSPSTSSILYDKPTLEANTTLENDRPFDPLGTAFFGVPSSFDVNEWTYYLNRMNQQQS
ncbi:fungal-specific transcription factor domain-containing protein [Halteromyces radiatus]|uniref:fungal-specific transcription factor domain-containing protein n=1 Tax=Halteromyces radiatus TaxID=101107 RepID=UPI0022211F3A|nr:fungal-specific transcription factor domain-containing protein [Halteromyces radiatus]KAI8093281.1 fungal-specific transcription factor domain-containing protein [Halteromyces radiatus]